MPRSTRQATPGPSTNPLAPINAAKRALSEDTSDADTRDVKRLKSESPSKSNKDKKKRRRKKKKISVVVNVDAIRPRSKPVSTASTRSTSAKPISVQASVNTVDGANEAPKLESTPSPLPTPTSSTDHTTLSIPPANTGPIQVDSHTTISKLQEDIQAKSTLIHNHEKVLSQIQQSVTCQICLDLLYKPYALAPCGHVTCHPCLVAWFTSPPAQEGPLPNQPPQIFCRRRKTCPHCRAVIRDRPVEVWAIKSMVSNLMQSGLLVGIPDAPQFENQTGTNEDPWKNIFLPVNRGNTLAPEGDPESFGLRDDDDGGIYRCLDCHYEIWEGECTHCGRIYPGHPRDEDELDIWDDSSEFDNDFGDPEEMALMLTAMAQQVAFVETFDSAREGGEYEDSFIDDDEEAEFSDSAVSGSDTTERHIVEPTEVIEVEDDEDDTPGPAVRRRHIMEILSDDEDEGDIRSTARRLGRGTRFNSEADEGVDHFTECEPMSDDDLWYSDSDLRSEDGYHSIYEEDDEVDMGHRWDDYDGSSQGSDAGGEFTFNNEDDGSISDHSGSMYGAYSDEDYY